VIKDYLPRFLYEESEIMNAIVEALEQEIEAFNTYASQRILMAFIDLAEGEFLDRIGKLAQVERKGMSDSEYRVEIKASILSTAGTLEVINNLLKNFFESFTLEEPGAGQLKITVTDDSFLLSGNSQDIVYRAIDKVKVAGVLIEWWWKIWKPLQESLRVSENVKTALGEVRKDDLAVSDIFEGGLAPLPHYWDEARWDMAEFS